MEKIKNWGKRIFKDIKEYSPAVLVFLGYYLFIHLIRGAFCPFLNLTGLPCAGCGLTRAFLYIAKGQLARAAYMNPMAFPIIGFVLYCAYFRYVKGTEIKGFKVLFITLVVCMLVFYVVRMYLYFPDRVPYVYRKNNLFAKFIPGYQDKINRLINWRRQYSFMQYIGINF